MSLITEPVFFFLLGAIVCWRVELLDCPGRGRYVSLGSKLLQNQSGDHKSDPLRLRGLTSSGSVITTSQSSHKRRENVFWRTRGESGVVAHVGVSDGAGSSDLCHAFVSAVVLAVQPVAHAQCHSAEP